MNTKKGFAPIIILIIIGILVVAGGAYYFGKQSSPTTPAPGVATNTLPEVATPTPTTSIPNPPAGQAYENQYMKVTIPPEWNLAEVTRTIQDQSYDKSTGKTTLIGAPRVAKTGAINITKGNYILHINTQASQASGVTGGRFAEISMGAPSVDAVVTEQPSPPCGTSENKPATLNHPRVDLYVSSEDKQSYCNIPSNGKTVWYFSYITDNNGSYFNYYKEGEALAYVITMGYNSKDVNSFPLKGSTALNSILNEMTAIVKSLEIK